jgi:uncharacterized protein YkwD
LRAAGANCRGGGNFAPAAALSWSPLPTQAAEAHSQDMVAQNFFSHTGSAGSSLGDRVNSSGYAWSILGENIAAGDPGIDKVMGGWIASDGHCANLMHPSFDQVGLVCVRGEGGFPQVCGVARRGGEDYRCIRLRFAGKHWALDSSPPDASAPD